MKLYLAIVASLLTPAHGAAVDVLDTPKNRRALRDNAEKIQCKGCLMSAQGGSVEKCKEWAAPPWNFGSAFENCEASDKDFVFEVPTGTVDCNKCKNDFKDKNGCPIITGAKSQTSWPYYTGVNQNDFAVKVNAIGIECWDCTSLDKLKDLYDFCTEKASSSPSPSPAPSPSPTPSGGGGGGGGGGDDPCFSRDTYACRLLDPKARSLGGESD